MDFLKTYFHISKNEIISDRGIVVRLGLMIVVTVLCLSAMGLSAYAYFSHSISSGNNRIQAANFDANVEVAGQSPEGNIYRLESGISYAVTMTKTSNATTGFGIIEITIGERTVTYFTEQLGAGGNAPEETVSFVLDLSAVSQTETVRVEFKTHIGTSCLYGYEVSDGNGGYIAEGRTVVITDMTTVTALIEEGSEEDGASEEDATPGEENTGTASTGSEWILYTIQSGDTLTGISQLFGVSIANIVAYNSIADPNVIRAGQVIIIPQKDWSANT